MTPLASFQAQKIPDRPNGTLDRPWCSIHSWVDIEALGSNSGGQSGTLQLSVHLCVCLKGAALWAWIDSVGFSIGRAVDVWRGWLFDLSIEGYWSVAV